MRIKINGQDIAPGDHITFDQPDFNCTNSMAFTIIIAGAVLIYWIAKGGLLG